MASRPQEYGELLLQFTTDFERTYDDKGSGADDDGSFWTPVPSEGFYILGSLGRGNYKNPNGEKWALCVRQTVRDSNALLHPVDWAQVWNDRGSKGNREGSCWEPVPPAGYAALGHFFVKGYDKPPLTAVVCVREDLTAPGIIGSSIWDDQGSNAKMDISVWGIDAPHGSSDRECSLAANTLLGVATYSRPAFHRSANVLRLPLVSTAEPRPPLPQLTTASRSGDVSDPVVDRSVLVPFTAVSDPDHDLQWQIANSPFYTVQRSFQYELLILYRNDTDLVQPVTKENTTGITTTETEQFSVTTGITVSYESGVSVGPASSKVSASLTIELGYLQSTSVSVMESMSTTVTMNVPPKHLGGLWTAKFGIQVSRADGSRVGAPLAFRPSSSTFLVQQLPPAADDASWISYAATLRAGGR